jgi:hypothetical protein
VTDQNQQRLDTLWAIEEIKRLKHRYLRTLDLKLWDEFAETLEPDAHAVYGARLDFTSRDEIVGFMRESVGPDVLTVHQCHHPEIDVDGDTATGTWSLQDQVIIWRDRLMITGACFYHDEYRRGTDGRWRIARTGYTRIFEAMESLDDRTDFRLTENCWAPDAD